MILYELTGSEQDPRYQQFEVANGNRQYDFLRTLVTTAVQMGRPFLSSHILKSLNYHAITCLHPYAGEFRPCDVVIQRKRQGDPAKGEPNEIVEKRVRTPEPWRVQALMDEFINGVNRKWESTPPIELASYVLWRLNHIHPFINGNGRTARAACYFVICVAAGGWLPGTTILPELIRRNREEYERALEAADASLETGQLNISRLHNYVGGLLNEQLASAGVSAS